MRALLLLGALVLALCQAQTCTVPPDNVINTGAELIPLNLGLGDTYDFTCVAGSTDDGQSTGLATITATCDPASSTQWDKACILYPDFCNNAGQALNRAAPTLGGFLGTQTTMTCQPGYTLAYATELPGNYRQVTQYTTSIFCAAMSFNPGTGKFQTNAQSGVGRWVDFDTDGGITPVYCEAIPDYCPSNAKPFTSVVLSADDELQFAPFEHLEVRSGGTTGFWAMAGTPDVTWATRKNYIGDVSTSHCQLGFDTDLVGAAGTNPSVTCVRLSDYGNGQWNYTSNLNQKASCVKKSNYCSTASTSLYNKVAQLYPILNGVDFTVDATTTATTLIPDPEAEIVCQPGYAIFPSQRSTSKHPLHCLPSTSTEGVYKHLTAPAAATYDYRTAFGPASSGAGAPCLPTDAYCSTDSSKQSPNYPFNYNTEPLDAYLADQVTLLCKEGYSFASATATSLSRQCRTGANTLYPIGGADVSRQWGFFVDVDTLNPADPAIFSNNAARLACTQINNYCTAPSTFSVHSSSTGLVGTVGNVVASTITDGPYSIDCPVGQSTDGTRTGAASRIYCAGSRVGAPPVNPWTIGGTWSTTTSPTVTAAQCQTINNFCLKTVDGTFVGADDGALDATRTRSCPNGYSASSQLIPPSFGLAPNSQNVRCVEDTSQNGNLYNSITGQVGKWVDTGVTPNAGLANCVKSTSYCQGPVTVAGAGFWSAIGVNSIARTIDTTWSARCLAGYALTTTKGSTATATLTCTDDTAAGGCWQISSTDAYCDESCVKVDNYCTAPPNVTVSPDSSTKIGETTTLVCADGYTTDGGPVRTTPSSNLQISATCSAYPSWSSGTDPNGVYVAGSTQFNGCLPAGSYCSLSTNLVAPVTGKVNDVATIICAVGYRIKDTCGTTPSGFPSREVSATCTPVSANSGVWRYASGCDVFCEQINDFCNADSTDILREVPFPAAPYQGTWPSDCIVGSALSKVDPAPQSFTRAQITAGGMTIRSTSATPFTAQCVTSGNVTTATVSGVWVVQGTSVYPKCVPVADFCNTGLPLNPAYDHYSVSATVPGGTDVGFAFEIEDPAAGTGTWRSNLFIQCDVGYVLDKTSSHYESNRLGVRMAGNSFDRASDLFTCRMDGVFRSSLGKGTGPEVCNRVQLCDFNPALTRITRKVCYDPENPSSQIATPCPLEAPATFFCEVGYLPQTPASAGYYDSGANRALISAATQATCNLSTTDLLTTGAPTLDDLTWSTTVGAWWYGTWVWETSTYRTTTTPTGLVTNQYTNTFRAQEGSSAYNYNFRKLSDGSVIDELTLCQRADNFCSSLALPNPNRSPYLANVASLTITNRYIDQPASQFTCQKGYQVVLGLNRDVAITPESTTFASVLCKGNPLIPEAGEWSVLNGAIFRPASCRLIDQYCPNTLGSFATASSFANSGKLNTTGTYCCAAGYSTTGVSATGSFVNLPMNCTAGPSANNVFARDGIWKTPGDIVPACSLITDYCPIATGAQLSTTATGPGSVSGTAEYRCATGYRLQGLSGLTFATFTCTAPSSLCGEGTNSGSWKIGSISPVCEPIDPYCPQTTITMVNRSVASTTQTAPTPGQLGDQQTIPCVNGWSSNGVAGAANAALTTTCVAASASAGSWSPASCIPTTDYCAASTVANTVATQTVALVGTQTIDSLARVDCLTGYTIGGVSGGATTAFLTCQAGATGFGQWTVPGGAPLTTTYCQPAIRTCSLNPPSATLGANATGATDSFAQYTCSAGYTFTGTATGGTSALAQCLFSDKQWHIGTPVASCLQATDWCPTAAAYSAANPGSILSLSAAPTLGSTGGFSCQNGYATTFVGSPVCLNNRTWSAVPCTLIPSYCTTASLGSFLPPGPAAASLGQNRQVTCAIGYQFISGAYLNVPVNCSALDQVKGVYKDSTGLDAFCGPIQSYCPTTTFSGVLTVSGALQIGAVASLTCNTGYLLAGGLASTSVVCSANDRSTGSWTAGSVVQNCSAIPDYCPTTITVDDNTVAATATVIGSSQVITCPVGWEATSGASVATVVCSPVSAGSTTGQWTQGGSAWTGCTRIPDFCPVNSVPRATLDTTLSTIDADNVANCLPGTTQTGFKNGATTFNIVCSATGWTAGGQSAGCSVVLDYCDTFALSRGAVTSNAAALGSTNTFDCTVGYQSNGATSVDITCNVTARWVDGNGDAFTGCTLDLNFCPDVVEANAVVSNGTNAIDSIRVITCDAGYTAGGAIGRTCLSTGNWSNVLVCSDIDECLAGPCLATEVCTNTPGNYTCSGCGLNEVVSNNQCVCYAPLYEGTAGNCTCTCAAHASCGASSCVCDAGYVNAVGTCEVCGGSGERCCDVNPSCGTGFVCSNGYCVVPSSPTPTPVPAPPPPATQTPSPPPPPTTGSSSSADDSGRLVVLFAYLLL